MAETEGRYAVIVAALTASPGVEHWTRKGFGQGGLKVGGKMFAMRLRTGGLLLKLPRARVDWLVDSGDGERFDPGHGKVMKEWVVIRADSAVDWLDLAGEALAFVRDGPAS
jgi:hypothetical protein